MLCLVYTCMLCFNGSKDWSFIQESVGKIPFKISWSQTIVYYDRLWDRTTQRLLRHISRSNGIFLLVPFCTGLKLFLYRLLYLSLHIVYIIKVIYFRVCRKILKKMGYSNYVQQERERGKNVFKNVRSVSTIASSSNWGGISRD